MGGALKPWQSAAEEGIRAAEAKKEADFQKAYTLFSERYKTNDEFERIKNNVWDKLTQLNTSLNERCEMSVFEKGEKEIKKQFNLTRPTINPTELEYLKNMLDFALKKSLEKKGIKIKLKLLRVPSLWSLKRKVGNCVNETESKRSVNEEKSSDEIKLERERHKKGLYTYNKFKKNSRSGHLMGLNITYNRYKNEIGNYEPILNNLKHRDIGEWIFTIVEEEDPTSLNDIAHQTGVITTPYLTVTQKTDE